MFNTVLPPNTALEDCRTGNGGAGDGQGIWSARSRHPGGVFGALCDGSVQFFSETIDSGDPTAPAVTSGRSPYGVWGALGTRNGGEVTQDNAF